MNKRDLQTSIIIIIEPDGTHHVKIPNDDSLEFSRKAYVNMMNTLTVLDEPSWVLRTFLWIERGMQSLSSMIFGQSSQFKI